MEYSFLCRFGITAVALACASGGGAPPEETTPHSHAGHLAEEQPHNAADETPTAPDTETAQSESRSAAELELAAFETARPIFEAHCAKCHTTQESKSSSKALTHFNMDRYPFGGHHAAEITAAIRKTLGAAGTTPTMPRDKPGAVKGEELRTILAWADAYDRAHANAPPSPSDDHQHPKSGHGNKH